MLYERKYVITSSHFNDDATYKAYWESQKKAEEGDFTSAFALLQAVLPAIHGHNFKVEITATAAVCPDDNGYLVDDFELEKLVRRFDNVNLSVLPEFGQVEKIRATTENIAEVLLKLCRKTFKHVTTWKVEVWEMEQIRAEVRWGW